MSRDISKREAAELLGVDPDTLTKKHGGRGFDYVASFRADDPYDRTGRATALALRERALSAGRGMVVKSTSRVLAGAPGLFHQRFTLSFDDPAPETTALIVFAAPRDPAASDSCHPYAAASIEIAGAEARGHAHLSRRPDAVRAACDVLTAHLTSRATGKRLLLVAESDTAEAAGCAARGDDFCAPKDSGGLKKALANAPWLRLVTTTPDALSELAAAGAGAASDAARHLTEAVQRCRPFAAGVAEADHISQGVIERCETYARPFRGRISAEALAALADHLATAE